MDHEMTIGGTLFDRVIQILEQARSNVVQSVQCSFLEAFTTEKRCLSNDNNPRPDEIGIKKIVIPIHPVIVSGFLKGHQKT